MTFIVYEPPDANPGYLGEKKAVFVEAESYSYKKHWYDIGSFSLTVPNTVNGIEKVKKDMILYVIDDYVNDSLVITSVKDDGLRTTLSGYDLKWLLSTRVTLFPQTEIAAGTYGYDVAAGSTGSIIRHYIEYNAGAGASQARVISGLCVGDVSGGIEDDTYMSRLQPLNEVIEALCKNADMGYSIDIISPQNCVYCLVTSVPGVDRTNAQSENAKMIFSDYTFSAESITLQESSDERKNLIWAVNGGTVDKATVTSVDNSTESYELIGFSRRETVTTVNCDPQDVGIFAKKDVNGKNKTEITVQAAVWSDYGTRYNVGDKVTVIKNGKSYDMRVLSAEKVYSGDSRRVQITLGDIPERKIIPRLSIESQKNKQEAVEQRLDKLPGGDQGSTVYCGPSTSFTAREGDALFKTIASGKKYGMIDSLYTYTANNGWVYEAAFNTAGVEIGSNVLFCDYTNNNVTNSQNCMVTGSHNTPSNSSGSLFGGEYIGSNTSGIQRSIIWGSTPIAGIPSPTTENVVDSIIIGQAHTILYSAVSNSLICGQHNFINQMQDGIVGGSYASAISTDRLVIGNGTQTATHNALRLDKDGVLYVHQVIPGGADYAETYEWFDGNPQAEERTGFFVTLLGDRIILADGDSDYILGVVSATPTVCGDTYDSYWHGKFERDVFGRILRDKNGDMIVSEKYDPDREYIPQSKRPEKAAVGTHGKLVVRDDGTCRVNGYCRPSAGGIATASAEKTDYRVIERRDENHIRIVIK